MKRPRAAGPPSCSSGLATPLAFLIAASWACSACSDHPSPGSAPPAKSTPGSGPAPTTANRGDGEPGRLLLLDLHGSLPERAPPFDLSDAPTLRKVLDRIAAATADPRTKTIFLRIGSLECGITTAGEVREALMRASAAGKRIACALSGGSDADLYLTSACARVTVAPAAELFFVGAHVEAAFLKPLLDKLGVVADFEHVGRWKGAAEPLTRDAPSPELAATFHSITDAADQQLIAAVARAPNLDPPQVSALLDRAPLTAEDAVAAKLFDEVGYADELLATESQDMEIIEAFPRGKPKEDFGSILDLFSSKSKGHPTKPHIALIQLVGPIVDGDDDLPWSDTASAGELVRALDEARRSDAVKAVVLRIDSPGGSALASDLIWRAVSRVREKKPILASMGSVAASGGYYVASGATRVYASSTTITGSIGVVGGKLVVAGLLDKLGIKTASFGGRAHARIMSPLTRFTPDERKTIQHTMESTYNLFVDRVAKGRGLRREEVLAVAEGRVWVGSEARRRKLVDELGGLDEVLREARKQGGLDENAPVDAYPAPKGLFDFLSRAGETKATAGLLEGELALAPRALRTLVSALPQLSRDLVWALMPIAFRVD